MLISTPNSMHLTGDPVLVGASRADITLRRRTFEEIANSKALDEARLRSSELERSSRSRSRVQWAERALQLRFESPSRIPIGIRRPATQAAVRRPALEGWGGFDMAGEDESHAPRCLTPIAGSPGSALISVMR